MGRKLIECRNVELLAGDQRLHSSVSLEITGGTIVHIQGTNGAGKSTLIKVLAGELKTSQGQVHYHFDKQSIFYIPQLQTPELHFPISLKEVTTLSQTKREQHTAESFEWFSKDLGEKSWNEASGGERMRTLLARALLTGSTVLILDEPFNHLDEQSHPKILESFENYVSNHDRAIVVVSHAPLRPKPEKLAVYKSWFFPRRSPS
jgi:ABC-type Mn2+/Zn2+ transport system ATPase subunit